MGSNSSSNNGSNDTQVSGYEKEINKQKAKEKAQKEAFAKYDKGNTNPNNNTQEKKKTVVTNNDGGGGGVPKALVTIAKLDPAVAKMAAGPTTAEVSQVTPEEARATANELILKKRRGRGRSLNMLQTSSQGITSDEGLTLGKKTLLG